MLGRALVVLLALWALVAKVGLLQRLMKGFIEEVPQMTSRGWVFHRSKALQFWVAPQALMLD